MEIDFSDFNTKVRLLAESAYENIAEKRIAKMKKATVDGISSWRSEVRELLSRPYVSGLSRGLWPMMRKEKLRSAVPTYKVSTRKSFKGVKHKSNQVTFYIKQNPVKEPWNTYGDKLDEFHPTLQGWKERAYDKLSEELNRRLYIQDFRYD